MEENIELLKQVEKLLVWKKGKSFIAEKLGVSMQEVNNAILEIRDRHIRNGSKEKETIEEAERGNYIAELEDMIMRMEEDVENGKGQLTVQVREEIKTLDELIEKCKIDTAIWKIDKYVQNFWGNADCPRWQVKAFLSKKKDFDPEVFEQWLKGFKPPQVVYKVKEYDSSKEEVDVLISIADFHLDRATIKDDTLFNKSKEYIRIVDYLVDRASSFYKINRLLFIIGNDFFNSDTFYSTTTNGTQQKDIDSFSKAYEVGFETLVTAINNSLPYVNKVEVILVQGNHDRTKSFYLAHAIDVMFTSNNRVSVDKENSLLKYTVSGDTFIGFHHGNCKIEELPLVFATGEESSIDFGINKYREILTADKHHYMAKEIKGVRVQQMPSLTHPSRWEADNNYLNNIRAGLAIIYHPTKGRIGELEERL